MSYGGAGQRSLITESFECSSATRKMQNVRRNSTSRVATAQHSRLQIALVGTSWVQRRGGNNARCPVRLKELLAITRDKICVERGAMNLYFTSSWERMPDVTMWRPGI